MWNKFEARDRRHERVRRNVSGTQQRPRLAVFRSAKHIYAQVVDDLAGKTLAHASSCEKDVRASRKGTKKTAVAEAIGKRIAERCKAAGITAVVFDRGGYRFHGRVAAVAKGAREGGLQF